MPLISVIVPVYKVEEYLSRCVDSILSQTFEDFELILIDDGSPDNCGKICDEYTKKDNRVHVIHQENGGLSSARNAGIDWAFENSDSEWLTFIDSDDWVHIQYLDLLLSAASEKNAKISVCEYKKVSNYLKPTLIPSSATQKISSEELYTEKNTVATIACGKLYKKSCFKAIRYPVGKIHEDEFVTYKLLFEQPYIVYLDAQLYFYYTNVNGIMCSAWSPKRLDTIIAREEQIVYFRKNGYINALKKVERILLWYIVSQIEITAKSDSYRSFSPELKKKLKDCIKDYKKDLNLSVKTDSGIYEKAYPKLTKFYWIIVSVLKKLKIIRR